MSATDVARVNRLDQMMIESGLLRLAPIDILAPARDRDHQHLLAPRLLAYAAARIEAVDARQAQVHQHDVGTQTFRGGQSLDAVVRHERLVPLFLQQDLQQFRVVGVVVDDEHAAGHSRLGTAQAAASVMASIVTDSGSAGRRTVNRLPRPGPSLCADTLPAVHLDEPFDEMQADAQTAVRPIGSIDLREHLEDARQLLGRNADPGIGDGHDGASAPVALDGDPDAGPWCAMYRQALLTRLPNT